MAIAKTGKVIVENDKVMITQFAFDGGTVTDAQLEALEYAKTIIDREIEICKAFIVSSRG